MPDEWQTGTLDNGAFGLPQPGGKTLLSFKQESPSDHVDPAEVLKALGIEAPAPKSAPEGAAAAAASPTCDGDVCEMPKKE